MLRCPKCSRSYETDTQKFCTHDGGRLERADESPAGFDPNATVHGNYAQFKEKGSMPSAAPLPGAPASEPAVDLNKTVMSQPPVVDPRAETSQDLAPTSQDLLAAPAPNDTSASLAELPEELDEVETQWGIMPPPMPEPEPAAPVAPPPPDQPAGDHQQGLDAQLWSLPELPRSASEASPPPPVEPPPAQPTPSANQYAGVAQASKLAAMLPPPTPKKNRRLGLIFAAVALLLFFFVIAVGVGGFLYWRNLQQQNANRILTGKNTDGNANTGDAGNKNSGSNTNANNPTNTNDNTAAPPSDQEIFTNVRGSLDGPLAEHYTDFAFNYPKTWKLNSTAGSSNFVDVMLRSPDNQPVESFAVSYYESSGSVAGDRETVERLAEEKSERFAKGISNYQKVSSGETTVNSIAGYEFRFSGNMNIAGAPNIWGRMVFLPPGKIGETNGVTLVMYVTSLSPEVRGVDDIGIKGDLPVILNSFKFGR